RKFLELARYITKPIQLVALIVLALTLLAILVLPLRIPLANALIVTIVVMTLGSVGIVCVLRGETISRASTDYSTDQMHESASENAPQELPEDLKIPDEIYHCVEPALKKLGFKVEPSVESLRWTKTYYYSNAIM